MVAQIYNHNTWEPEVEGLQIQCQHGCMGYIATSVWKKIVIINFLNSSFFPPKGTDVYNFKLLKPSMQFAPIKLKYL
jgi:hypothetical protein